MATNNRMALLEQLSKYVVEKDKDFLKEVRIPDYSDSISGSIRTIKPDTSGHLVMYFDFT